MSRVYVHGDVVTRLDPHNPFAAPVGSVFCLAHDSFECPREDVIGPCRGCMKRLARDIREAGSDRPVDAPNVLDLSAPCGARSHCTCRRKKRER